MSNEKSWFWDGTFVGDAGPYDRSHWQEFWANTITARRYNHGVIITPSGTNLAVSNPAGRTMRVAPGYALVNGAWYKNDANLDLQASSLPNDVAAPRVDLVVLEKNVVAQTVRARIVEGIASTRPIPEPVIQSQATFQLPLAQYKLDSSGAVSDFQDLRRPAYSSSSAIAPFYSASLAGQDSHTVRNVPLIYNLLRFEMTFDAVYGRPGGSGMGFAVGRTVTLTINNDPDGVHAWVSSYRRPTAGVTTSFDTAVGPLKIADVMAFNIPQGGTLINGFIGVRQNAYNSVAIKVFAKYESFSGSYIQTGYSGGFYHNGTTPLHTLTFETTADSFGRDAANCQLRLWGYYA